MAPLLQSLSLRWALSVLLVFWFSLPDLVVAAPTVSSPENGTMVLESGQIEKRQTTSKLVFAHFLVSVWSCCTNGGTKSDSRLRLASLATARVPQTMMPTCSGPRVWASTPLPST
jgi:hypothetical protein